MPQSSVLDGTLAVVTARRSAAEVSALLSARDRSRTFPWRGLRVGRLWLDQGFALELHTSEPPAEEGALLRFFRSFLVDLGDGPRAYEAHEHESLTPLFSLLGRHVIRAGMTSKAGLRMEVEGGATLSASSLDDDWEFQQPWRPRFDQ